MKSLTYTGKVAGGKITLPKRLRQEVTSSFEGKRIKVTFERERKQRSDQQNRYYWSVVIPYVLDGFIEIGNDLQSGNSDHKQMIHEAMKRLHLDNGVQIGDANGELISLPPSTKRLTTIEMMDYIDRVTRWAQECLNVTIPEPNEQATIF